MVSAAAGAAVAISTSTCAVRSSTAKGRLARLWFLTLNEAGDRVGAVVPYYTGRMVGFSISGSATMQTAKITIESYLASLTAASNRTYLDQGDFVTGDSSASLTLAVANGAKSA